MENLNQYIIPTKKSPVFVVSHDYIGYIERSLYKRWFVQKNEQGGGLCGETFATFYTHAIEYLHEYIIENPEVVTNYPKATITIFAIDGSKDKNGEVIYTPVYKITAKKAIKYIL